jgi:hypothetical protein
MGTFHQNRDALHGITVVVDTSGPEVYIGRCDDITESRITLWDVQRHCEGEGVPSKAEYLERAARLGIWPQKKRLALPLDNVISIRPLGEYLREGHEPPTASL